MVRFCGAAMVIRGCFIMWRVCRVITLLRLLVRLVGRRKVACAGFMGDIIGVTRWVRVVMMRMFTRIVCTWT